MIIEIFLWATLPAILVSIYIAKKDFFPEPKAAIAASIILGFLIFIPHYLVFEFIGDYYWKIYSDNLYDDNFIYLLESFFQAAFIEETLKFFVFLFLVSKFNAFNEPMDAIVYGVCISLGFSLMETLEWTNIVMSDYGEEAAMTEARNRSWSSNTMHAGCGVLMGFFLSKAFFQNKNNFLRLILALIIPTLIHGFYNFSISSENYAFTLIILIICILLIFVGWRKSRSKQLLKKVEHEIKVIDFNFIHISVSGLINLILVIFLINILK